MKNIKLTNKQMTKLEKMIKTLFPQYDEVIFDKMYEPTIELEEGTLHLPYKDVPWLLWLIDHKKDEFEVFSWFEFVYTILLDKLVKHLGYENSTDYVGMDNGIPLDNTIIDYIYKYIYPLYK